MEYTLPSHRIAVMIEKVAHLNKRANKLGLNTILSVVPKWETERIERVYSDVAWDVKPESRDILVVDVELLGDMPKLDGWRLVAVLSNFEGQVLIETVPGESVDNKYWSTRNPEYCDHCHTNRARNETFLVQHNDGRVMQVGRQCMKDFLGHNANALMTWGNLFAAFDAEFRGNFAGAEQVFKMSEVMPVVVAVCRDSGWVSRTKARESYAVGPATADRVLDVLELARTKEQKQYQEKIAALIDDSVKSEAQRIIDFTQQAVQKDDLNDYEYNLSVIYNREVPIMSHRTAGIACSAIAYYNNAMKQKVEREARPESNWLGSVGDKIVATITVKHKQFLESDYGTTVLLKMEDESGNQVTWFGTGQAAWDMEVDNTYTIKGSIKKCDEYKGIKQTVLTRVKVA